jgi:hypothetical protein
MAIRGYKAGVSVSKGFWAAVPALVLLVGVVAAELGAGLGALELPAEMTPAAWALLVSAVCTGLSRGIGNARKQRAVGDWLRRIGFGVVLLSSSAAAMAMGGCATSARTEFVDADGTSFTAVSKAGPFGQLDVTNQQLAYKWDSEQGSIAVGNEAQGLDNSGQVAAVQAVAPILSALVQAGIIAPGGGGQDNGGGGIGGGLDDTLERFDRICELLCRIAPEQAAGLCGCGGE